jgi:integrase
MRLKDYDERDGKRVWLSEQEIQTLIEKHDPEHGEMKAAMILAARCGLRRNEIVQVTPVDLTHNQTGSVVRVWDGKGDKYREPPAPPELSQMALAMGKNPDEPIVDVADSTVYDWISRAATRARAETRDEGWQFVGPHDLRRSWGVRILESGVLPSVVMEWGGWEDWQTFRDHYLAEFSPEALRRERTKVSWLSEGRSRDDDAGSDQGYAAVDPASTGTGY